jgi:hypothetical protein
MAGWLRGKMKMDVPQNSGNASLSFLTSTLNAIVAVMNVNIR